MQNEFEKCDLCGGIRDGLALKPGRCQVGFDWNMGGVIACDGSRLASPDADIVREAMRAPLLRAALKEALDEAEGWARYAYTGDLPDSARVFLDRMRTKHLGGK